MGSLPVSRIIRRNNGVEQDPKSEWADDEVQEQTEFCPQPIERHERTRRGIGQHGEQRRKREPVMPALAVMVDTQRPQQCKKPAKTRPKPRSDEILTTLLSRLELMSAEILVLLSRSTARMAQPTLHNFQMDCKCYGIAQQRRQASLLSRSNANRTLSSLTDDRAWVFSCCIHGRRRAEGKRHGSGRWCQTISRHRLVP